MLRYKPLNVQPNVQSTKAIRIMETKDRKDEKAVETTKSISDDLHANFKEDKFKSSVNRAMDILYGKNKSESKSDSSSSWSANVIPEELDLTPLRLRPEHSSAFFNTRTGVVEVMHTSGLINTSGAERYTQGNFYIQRY